MTQHHNNKYRTGTPHMIGSNIPQPPTVMNSLSITQLQSLANAQFNAAYQQILTERQKQWMVNGVPMTWSEFLDAVCPDPDDPHRTYLTLKYQGTT